MSRMFTRVGPTVVEHLVLKGGAEVTSVGDTNDKELFMVFPDWPFEEGLKWALEYVDVRYGLTLEARR